MTNNNQPDENCIFCNIVSGKTPADIVHEGNDTLYFRDVSPKASVHILGIPKAHMTSLAVITEDDQELIGRLVFGLTVVARKLGIEEGGYRIISNIGNDAGQDIKHIHFHLLGGERLGPLKDS